MLLSVPRLLGFGCGSVPPLHPKLFRICFPVSGVVSSFRWRVCLRNGPGEQTLQPAAQPSPSRACPTVFLPQRPSTSRPQNDCPTSHLFCQKRLERHWSCASCHWCDVAGSLCREKLSITRGIGLELQSGVINRLQGCSLAIGCGQCTAAVTELCTGRG